MKVRVRCPQKAQRGHETQRQEKQKDPPKSNKACSVWQAPGHKPCEDRGRAGKRAQKRARQALNLRCRQRSPKNERTGSRKLVLDQLAERSQVRAQMPHLKRSKNSGPKGSLEM